MYNNNTTKAPWKKCILFMVATLLFTTAYSKNSRFRFINDKTETSFRFTMVQNLIVIPVKVNDMDLNLILDTGMRSIVLFGKHFERKLETLDDVTVRLSGYGKKKNRPGKLSLGNEINIADVLGTEMGIVIMPSPDLFRQVGLRDIDGIIGYEIFSRFKVKIDYPGREITLYEPFVNLTLPYFDALPLTIKDTKPYVQASMIDAQGTETTGYFHIDTGSAQDVLLFHHEDKPHNFKFARHTSIGVGIGGKIKGYKADKTNLKLGRAFNKEVESKYVLRGFSNRELQDAHGSIGSDFLSDSIIVFDYIHQTMYIGKAGALAEINYIVNRPIN